MALILVSRLCCTRGQQITVIRKLPQKSFFRFFSQESRETIHRTARRKTLRERAMAPAGDGAFSIGRGAVAGGAALGLGALCYYGLGLSNEAGALEKSVVWPQFVKDRIKTTYSYFGASLAVTAASAMASFRSPLIMNLVMRHGFSAIALSMAVIMGTGMLVQNIPYNEGFGAKQMAWLLHTGTLGALLAPMCFLGGPLLIRAAWYTAGIVGGLSTIAVCAPSEKFLMMGAPLGMGLGVVFVSAVGSVILPPTTALGAGLYSIFLYGGLLLISGFVLYDTQRIIAQAERYPTTPEFYNVPPYDPINASLAIYLDTINIFIRIVSILGSGNQKRR